jgi:hypothetical protein
MTHTSVSYAGKTQEAGDKAALKDLKQWLGVERYGRFLGISCMCKTAQDVASLNFLLGFAGATGRPFHALCRKECPKAYALWQEAEPVGDDLKVGIKAYMKDGGEFGFDAAAAINGSRLEA